MAWQVFQRYFQLRPGDLSEFDRTRLNAEFVAFFKTEIEFTPVSIRALAGRYGVEGQTLRKQYKEKISGYQEWKRFGRMEFNKALDAFSNRSTTIISYFEERLTMRRGILQCKNQGVRSQLRGVSDVKFFMFRLATLYA